MAAPQRREPGSAHLAPEEAGLFHGIVEQLGGAALLCDRDGTVRWANSRASEWLGATACCGTAQLDALSLPWPLDATQLAAACDGATQRLRPAMLDCADGVARRCHARLAPLRRGAQPALALLWIDEQPDDDGGAPSETQRRRALAAAQVGSWNRNLEAGAARVDPLWCHALGLDPCEGPAHLELWARRIHPDDVERFRRAAEELACAAEGAPDFDVEYRILTVDSRWLWVLQRGRVTRRARDGRPLHAAGICIDIDARKRAEVEVHENESRLATALWGAQAAFWQLHVPSDTATRSPLWFAMTGYSREAWDAVPQPWMSRLHPDDRPEVERRIAEHIAGRSQSLELRYRMKCADGAWKWMMDRGRVVEWDFDGRAIRAIGVSLDIDAQRRAELELHSSEARLETAVWGAGVGLYELDCPSGVTRWLNDWCERFDIDPCAGAEHVDRWDSNIHPDDLPAARARFSGHLAGSEEYYDAEYRIRTRGGAWRWIYERGRVTERDAAGAPLRLVGTCLDIDARRRVELAADESRRRLELALEGARGCLWEWDIARDEYSDAYYELHGVDPEAGRRNRNFWNECAHPDDRERVLAAERELIEGRIESFDTQYRIRHADGSWRWLVDRYRAGERDASGRATRLIGVAIDVTEEVQVRAALEASESSLRAIAQNAPDWMFLLGRDLRIRFANREVPGRSVAGLVGCAALDVVDPQWREVFRGHFEAVLQDGEPVSFDQLRPAPDGSTVVYLHRVNAVRDARGAIEGLAVMVTDVTAQRDAQLALQRSERLLRTVTANSNDWLVLLDHEHRLRFVNRPVGTQSVSRLLGRSALDIVEPESVPAMRAALDAVLANGQPRVVMQRLPATALHGPRHLEVWVTAAFDGAAITGTVLTVSDVTERVRQQQALLTQAQVLETMARPCCWSTCTTSRSS
jgi:PAS domain S-box-containing protein